MLCETHTLYKFFFVGHKNNYRQQVRVLLLCSITTNCLSYYLWNKFIKKQSSFNFHWMRKNPLCFFMNNIFFIFYFIEWFIHLFCWWLFWFLKDNNTTCNLYKVKGRTDSRRLRAVNNIEKVVALLIIRETSRERCRFYMGVRETARNFYRSGFCMLRVYYKLQYI